MCTRLFCKKNLSNHNLSPFQTHDSLTSFLHSYVIMQSYSRISREWRNVSRKIKYLWNFRKEKNKLCVHHCQGKNWSLPIQNSNLNIFVWQTLCIVLLQVTFIPKHVSKSTAYFLFGFKWVATYYTTYIIV